MKDNWMPLEELAEGIRDVLGDEEFYDDIKEVLINLENYEINIEASNSKELLRFSKEYLVSITHESFRFLPYSMLNAIAKGDELINETIS